MSVRAGGRRYTPSGVRATHRGGGLYSSAVSQRIGSVIAAAAGNAGLHPTVLTLASLTAGLLSSLLGALAGVHSAWLLGLVALLGWQLAYAFDCADGQLARASGQTSPYGARIDVLVDFTVQTGLVAAVVTVADHWSHPRPALLGAYATLWVVSLFTSVLAGSDAEGATRLLSSGSPAVAVGKLVRDYGFVVLVLGLLLTVRPSITVWFVLFFLVLNGLFLLVSVGRAAQLSLRHPGR